MKVQDSPEEKGEVRPAGGGSPVDDRCLLQECVRGGEPELVGDESPPSITTVCLSSRSSSSSPLVSKYVGSLGMPTARVALGSGSSTMVEDDEGVLRSPVPGAGGVCKVFTVSARRRPRECRSLGFVDGSVRFIRFRWCSCEGRRFDGGSFSSRWSVHLIRRGLSPQGVLVSRVGERRRAGSAGGRGGIEAAAS
ncbi:hypothetical protein Dimus_005574 [Dionaea muscipula]